MLRSDRAARLSRVAGVALVVLVVASGAATAPVAAATQHSAAATPDDAPPKWGGSDRNQQQQARTIDSCTAVTEPGRYELSGDVQGGSERGCIHVRASDVVIDGNGYTVSGASDENSTGVFVYNGTETEQVELEDRVSNVTVQNLRVTNWGYGVRAGTVFDGGDNVTVRNVVARDNVRDGVHMWFIQEPVIENVTSVNNGEGMFLREVQRGTVRELNVSNNVEHGLHLSDVTTHTNFTDLTVTGNGDGSEYAGGIYVSTDAFRNVFEDAYVANNDGAGVKSSDAGDNVFRNFVVESNTRRGFFGENAGPEHLQNVTLRDNGGDELAVEQGSYDAERLVLGDVATLSFASEPLALDLVSLDELPNPPGEPTASSGVRVSNVESGVTMTFPSQSANADVSLWHYDGTEWTRVPNTTVEVDAGTISGTVTSDGVVVPLMNSGDGTDDGGATTTSATRPTTSTTTAPTTTTPTTTTPPEDTDSGTGVSGTDAVFEILSTSQDANFQYEFTVAGTVEGTQTQDVSADAGDTVQDNGDGTVTVTGSTGNAAGDAFLVSGEVLDFTLSGADDGYQLVFDGQDVTDQLAPPQSEGDDTTTPTTTEEPPTDEPTTEPPATGEPDGGTGISGTDAVFEILSTQQDSEFEYEFVVDGTVEPTQTEDVSADSGDTVQENDDGTVTVTGSTGNAAGDAFLVSGEILEFTLTGADEGYRLVFDGEDVTSTLVPPSASNPATFVVRSTADANFGYIFVVAGDAMPTETADVAADVNDHVVHNGDGTVTVIGSTGSQAGDAFDVTGPVVEFYTPAAPGAYALFLDGVDVTDDVPRP